MTAMSPGPQPLGEVLGPAVDADDRRDRARRAASVCDGTRVVTPPHRRAPTRSSYRFAILTRAPIVPFRGRVPTPSPRMHGNARPP